MATGRLDDETTASWEWDVPCAKLCSYGVGGKALALAKVGGGGELQRVLQWCNDNGLPWKVIGGGSNLLVSDAGFPGVVIKLDSESRIQNSGCCVTVGAGMSGGALLTWCEKQGLSGIEFMDGIPGTLGGWVAGNAGVKDAAIGDVVAEVEIFSHKGALPLCERKILQFSYRRTEGLGDGAILLSVTLRLRASSPEAVRAKRLEYRAKRFDFSGMRTAGSVFKNPPGQSAGKLLDDAGCKGMRVGGAVIYERHANVIVAGDGATASDVLALIQLMEQRAPTLEREIRVH